MQAFFFEKKNQKTFVLSRLLLVQAGRQWAKVFASFFKKKRFLSARQELAALVLRRGRAQSRPSGEQA